MVSFVSSSSSERCSRAQTPIFFDVNRTIAPRGSHLAVSPTSNSLWPHSDDVVRGERRGRLELFGPAARHARSSAAHARDPQPPASARHHRATAAACQPPRRRFRRFRLRRQISARRLTILSQPGRFHVTSAQRSYLLRTRDDDPKDDRAAKIPTLHLNRAFGGRCPCGRPSFSAMPKQLSRTADEPAVPCYDKC